MYHRELFFDLKMPGKQKKRARQSQRGIGDYWDEMKHKYTLALTPSSVANLDAIAQQLEISRSELVEQIGRGIIGLKLDALVELPYKQTATIN